MRKILSIIIIALTASMAASAQAPGPPVVYTPNLHLALPPSGYYANPSLISNLLNTNFSVVDSTLGSGVVPYAGVWSSTITYGKGQMVSQGSVVYYALLGANTNNSPSTSPSYWGVVPISGGSMVYPPAGIAVSTGSAWSSAAAYGNIVGLWTNSGGGACTGGYLSYNGTCSTPSGGSPVSINGATVTNPNFINSGTVTFGVGGSDISLTATGGGGVTLPFVTPETYGAEGDGNYFYDGATTVSLAVNSGSSTTPVTTTASGLTGDVALGIFSLYEQAWSSAPATGTNRVNQAGSAGVYGAYVNSQVLSSPGAVAPYGGTLAGSDVWAAASLVLQCAGSCTYVNSSTVTSTSSSTATLNTPTGLANGDFMLLCTTHFSGTLTWPTGYTNEIINVNSASNMLECRTKVAASEPGSYTITQSSSFGMTSFVLAYTNASIETSSLTSATAGFTSGDVGDDVCVAGTTTSGTSHLPQWCGTIVGYTSATAVRLSGSVPAVGTGLQFVYGTDDSTAFADMLTDCATKGCYSQLAPKAYMISSSLTFSPDVPIEMIGSGPGVQNTANNYLGVPLKNTNVGTRLVVATTGLSAAALVFNGGSTSTSATVNDKITDLALIAGAGINRDGGGADGIDLNDWQGFYLSNVYIFNFAGNGMDVSISNDSISTYGTKIKLDQLYISFNNGYGLELATAGGPNLETVEVDTAQIEANGKQGLLLGAGAVIQGFTLTNSVIQWNNITTPGTEVSIPSAVTGCEIRGNYFEVDGDMGSQSTAWVDTLSRSYDGCNYGTNVLFPGDVNMGGSIASSGGDMSPWSHVTQAGAGRFAGTCDMSTSTTCTFNIAKAFLNTPICTATPQGTTPAYGACSVSGTVVTVTAATPNSLIWGATLVGNPN